VRLVTAEERDRLLATCQREAVHLEMRDVYGITSEAKQFADFLATGVRDLEAEVPDWQYWTGLIRGVRLAGRRVRRARIVSEPVTDYIRYEWAGTPVNIAAGEEVRWLPRRSVSSIALPGNDFWLFDGTTAVFTVFTGAGDIAERQVTDDPATVQLCSSAFEAVWTAAVPHSEYTPR
jgi:hypothetical protein